MPSTPTKNRNNILKYILPCLLFGILCGEIFLHYYISNMDNIWNFTVIKQLAKGLKPYQDVSFVQMPGWAYLAVPFVWIFDEGFFTMRVLHWLFNVLVVFLVYCSAYRLTGSWKKGIAFASIGFVATVTSSVYSYNFVIMAAVLAGSFLDFTSPSVREKAFLMGILYGIPITCKQSSGLIIFVVHLVCCATIFIYTKNKYYLRRAIWSVVPLGIVLGGLAVGGVWNDFVDYAIKGLFAFSSSNNRICLTGRGFILLVLLFAIGIMFLYGLYKKKYSGFEIVAAVSSFAICSDLYPQFDDYRVEWSLAVLVPVIILVWNRTFPTLFTSKILRTSFYAFLCAVFAFVTVNHYSSTISGLFSTDIVTEEKPNYLTGVVQYNYIDKYIKAVVKQSKELEEQGYEIYYAFGKGVIFDFDQDRYIKNYDLLMTGNIGVETAESLFRQATEGNSKTAFFVLKDPKGYQMCRDEVFELRDLIMEKGKMLIADVCDAGWYSVYEYCPSA